ncbi:PP2C family serine/threonine-protein phosphatase [Nubsella zeaxanthinifaciens]|uniref:PP2C family serine/threonine-protein phosphatase n=1 Tax=Nubsella zeaxanthinifaciens TaxID=392412 RepID=UPI003D062CB6
MNETEAYLKSLFHQKGIVINAQFEKLFECFANDSTNINAVKSIRQLQEDMTKEWKLIARRAEINDMQFGLPNAVVGKPYAATINLKQLGLEDVAFFQFSGFEDCGISFQDETHTLSGSPKISGDIWITFSYKLAEETEDTPLNHKQISFIINPDPKSLWKDIPSNADDVYAKADQVAQQTTFLSHTLQAISKRGRSHANKGSFRDDDFAFTELKNGWGVLVVSDGAGSAPYARKGAALACKAIIDYFVEHFNDEVNRELESVIVDFERNRASAKSPLATATPYLSAAALNAHQSIANFAANANKSIDDFHATLSFVLIKQLEHCYAFFSFSIGDGPIALLDKQLGWVKPLNQLDVGAYGGGTRFITMPEIFEPSNFQNRFNFELTSALPYVFLMTDGIFDPKFEVEANLNNIEKWKIFMDDLKGANEEGIDALDSNKPDHLAKWANFWSPGNHDDRTLLILS